MTEGPCHKNGPWRLDFLGILPHDRYADRRNPLLLYFPLDQSDGLIANTSPRCQKDEVDGVVLQLHSDLSTLFDQRGNMPARYVPHEPVMPVR